MLQTELNENANF